MKATPKITNYNGHTFRSQREARWAVIFDQLAIQWQFEPEKLVVPSDNPDRPDWWLPDFYLPDVNAFVEVKSDWSSVEDEYLSMLMRSMLAGGPLVNGASLVLLEAIPAADFEFTYYPPHFSGNGHGLHQPLFTFHGRGAVINKLPLDLPRTYTVDEFRREVRFRLNVGVVRNRGKEHELSPVNRAFWSGWSARFEEAVGHR